MDAGNNPFSCQQYGQSVGLLCYTDRSCSKSAADRQVSPEDLERLRKLAVEKQKEGAAPLPVVRLCFVGRGRAGKTTTLRQAHERRR